MSSPEQNRKRYKDAYDAVKVSPEMKERLMNMKYADISTKSGRKIGMGVRVAAAALAFVLLGGTSVYAAQRFNWFEGLFAESDVTLIDEYAETPESVADSGVYQGENEDWLVTVDQYMYNEATDYGIVQFTVVDKSEKCDWYGIAEYHSFYSDWDMPAGQQIYGGTLGFGLTESVYSNRVFISSQEGNKTVCQMTFSTFKDIDMKNRLPKLTVFEMGDGDPRTIMKLDMPVGESIPSYCWRDADGEVRLLLSSVDFHLLDAPESSIHGSDIILCEVSVQMKDGSSYIVRSEAGKAEHIFYCTGREDGFWGCFDRAIDLENVVSFSADGETFHIEDAVLE